MERKLVFLDIDGTLSDIDGYIPPSTVEACRRARAAGHLLYVCSGRPRGIIGKAILDIGFDGIIASAGAHIETAAKGGAGFTTVFDTAMPAELTRRIAAYLVAQGSGYSFEKNDELYSDGIFLEYWRRFMDRFLDEATQARMMDERAASIERSLFPDPVPAACFEGVNKILFVEGGAAPFERVKETFAGECEIFRGSFAFAGAGGGEIGPRGIHKGWAVAEAARLAGIAVSATIAFGDSDNDTPMLEAAGTGVAMGNAEESLKERADYVTAPLREDGISKGFRHLGLI